MKLKLRKLGSGGGFPPLVSVYTPVQVTNPYTNPVLQALDATIQGNISKQTTKSDIDDATKLLSNLDGLTNDVDSTIQILNQKRQYNAVFGESDPVGDYYQNIALINKIKQGKEQYKQALDIIKAKDGIDDIATTSTGKVVVKDKTGKISAVNPEDLAKMSGVVALTNGNLLSEREHNPNYTFQDGDDLSRIVSEGTSLEEIQKIIKDFSSNLGTTTQGGAGFIQAQKGQILQGIDILKNLSKDAVQSIPADGIYKIKFTNSSNAQQAQKALEAIWQNLTPSQQALLKVQTNDGSTRSAQNLIATILSKGISSSSIFDIDQPSGSGKKGKSSNSDSEDGVDKEGPMAAFFRGLGEQQTFTITGNTSHGIVTKANIMPIIGSDGKPVGENATLTDLSQTPLAGGLDLQHASMGNGEELDSKAFDNVLISGQVAAAEIPIEQTSNGKIVPAINTLSKMDKANDTLRLQYQINPNWVTANEQGFTQHKQIINKVYQQMGLQPLYTSSGSINIGKYRRFAMVKGTTTEKSFKNSSVNLSAIEASENSRAHYIETMKTKPNKSKFDISNGFLGMGMEDVYEGTIFIPMNNNYMGVAAGSGEKAYLPSDEWTKLNSQQEQNARLRESKLDLSKLKQ